MVEGCGALTKEEEMPKCIPVVVKEGTRDVTGRKVPPSNYWARPAHLKGGDNVALYGDQGGKSTPTAHVAAKHIIEQ